MGLTEQRIVFLGAGSAGCGIASLLLQAMVEAGASENYARHRFFAVDRNGLIIEGQPDIKPVQQPCAQQREAVAKWILQSPGQISLHDVMANAKPTVLIGASGQTGAFVEPVVHEMVRNVERPVIFPLSNPTSRNEATPEQIMHWTDGRALIGTGSPFPPVDWHRREVKIDQTNNAYVFPGVGLGVIACGARRVTDTMFMAAAKALADLSPTLTDINARLLPAVSQLRSVAFAVARAVGRQAQMDGLANDCNESVLINRIRACIWEPRYRPYRRIINGKTTVYR